MPGRAAAAYQRSLRITLPNFLHLKLFRRKSKATFSDFVSIRQLRDLDKVIVKGRAGANVGQRLRDRLIYIAAVGTELVPPGRKRAGQPRLQAVRNSRNEMTPAAVIEYRDRIAVGNLAGVGILRVY
jgi:hypothetical protein